MWLPPCPLPIKADWLISVGRWFRNVRSVHLLQSVLTVSQIFEGRFFVAFVKRVSDLWGF